MGEVRSITSAGENIRFRIASAWAPELKIDQSISHNGVCLTVEEIDLKTEEYVVSAIQETLDKTNLGLWAVGQKVNLERSVTMDKRLDGHMVQGHIDETVVCRGVEDKEGSFLISFELPPHSSHLLIPQGSVALDGISLTVARLEEEYFSVAIIPYTYAHTTAGQWKSGSVVNVEYDVFGKYFARYMEVMKRSGR